jgi:CubicO group peptidase (beta-lactamase class C family)/D-alanyl-D-alanine dipeptidase
MTSARRSLRLPPILLLALSTVTTAPIVRAENVIGVQPTAKYNSIADRLTDFINAEQRSKNLPAVSIALVDDDRVVWSAGFGPEDAAGKRPASSKSVYRVGSVSKLFTDLAVMQLVAEKKIDLDAEVRRYLPDFMPENPYDVQPTVRQLMNHRSGLVREPPVGSYFDDTDPSIADTVRSLNETKLVHKPGSTTKYSNAGVSVAGLIVERMAGRPFEEHMQQALLRPMEMHSSSYYANDELNARLAHGWMWCRHLPRFDAPKFALGTLPAGNLYSTVDDLGNFLITVFNDGAFRGKQVIPAATLQSMLASSRSDDNKPHDYGIGFRLSTLDGRPTFGHGGAVYGYATQLTGLPEEKLGVVAIVAIDGGNGVTRRLSEYALRLMLAQREDKPLPEIEHTGPLPARVAAKISGVYASGEETIQLEALYDKLCLHHDTACSEVRACGDSFTVDDLFGFGPKVKPSDDYASITVDDKKYARREDKLPPACPEKWRGLIGEYGPDHNILYIYERDGRLWALVEWFDYYPLTEVSDNVFAFPNLGLYPGEHIVFTRDEHGTATEAKMAGVPFQRRELGAFKDGVFRVRPVRPIDQLQAEALAAEPPHEARPFRKPDLVEINSVDPSIKLDVRYAGVNNFLGAKIYDSAHSYLQRPAAEALARVHQALKPQGYGLLVHDAYRPWYVTKMFWDATPDHLHAFVADPAQGSRHNRGCAVDLTLFELATGKPVEMVGVYDEMSPRSYPLYPGGEGRQRWHRDLLRKAMEREGFTVYEVEWWHFDYKDWKQYPIVNLRFEELKEK